MASRVNVRFVVMLSIGLALAAALVGGAAVFVISRSAAQNIRAGDAAMAAGDYEAAEEFYSRAVNKEQGNLEYLAKWREALTKLTPASQTEYAHFYQMYAGPLLRAVAFAQGTNVDAHYEYLEEMRRRIEYAPSPRGWEALPAEAEAALRFFSEPPGRLRRFRGNARVALDGLKADVSPDQRELAAEDLRAALEADPGDAQAAASLATWHLQRAAEHRELGEDEEAAAQTAEARRVVDAFCQANPDSVHGALVRLRLAALEADQSVPNTADMGAMIRAKREAFERCRPQLEQAVAAISAADAAELDAMLVLQFQQAARVVDPEHYRELTEAALERALAANPTDADLLFLRGVVLAEAGRHEEAIAAFQKVVDLPQRPISFEGMRQFERKPQARLRQAESAMALVRLARDDESRQAALERAKQFRRDLTEHIAENVPPVMLLDAQIALAENDGNRAYSLLVDYNRLTDDSNTEALALLGDLALRVDQPGLARRQFERILELQPGNIGAVVMLAQIDMREQKYHDAVARYREALDLDPDNEAIRRDMRIAESLATGKVVDGDPILQVLIDVENTWRGLNTVLGDEVKAIRMLEEAIAKHGPDARLYAALVTLHLARNELAEAEAALQAGEAANPGHPALQVVRERLRVSGSLEAAIQAIDDTNAPEAVKLVRKYMVYKRHGKHEQARAALRTAAERSPDDPAVIELSFGEALAGGDFEAARELADRAARLDLDRANGQTYQARILAAKGQTRDAALTLEKAVESHTATAPTLRLLAVLQLELGRTPDALRTFEGALSLNPTDLDTIKLYVNALRQAGHESQALAVARRSEVYGRRDREFLATLLDLEARVGNLSRAIAIRQEWFQREPGHVENTLALAGLYVNVREWDRAKALIDRLRQTEDTLRVAEVEARWHAEQADFQAAYNVFLAYIDRRQKAGETIGPEPYMALGQFMIERGQVDVGLAALEKAAEYQDPATREADMARAEALFRLARYAEAESIYRDLIAAGLNGPSLQVSKRLLDTLIQLKRYGEAEQLAASMGQTLGDDLALLIQRSVILEQMGERRRAREIVDLAATKFPDQALPYFRRAQLLMTDEAYVADALADLDTALRLNPQHTQSLRLRAGLYVSMGRVDDALRDMRTAVEADPSQTDMLLTLIAELVRRGRESEAIEVAERAWRDRPSDARLAVQIGETFASLGRWGRAAAFYRSAYEQFQEEITASRLVLALARSEPPGLDEAERVLSNPALKVDNSPRLLLARAAVDFKRGRPAEAEKAIAAAFLGCGTDLSRLGFWYDSVLDLIPDRSQLVALLGRLPVVDAEQKDWLTFFRAQTMIIDPDTRSEGIHNLEQLARGSEEPELLKLIYRLLSPLYFQAGRFEDCAEVSRRGLALDPEDAELANNLAFVLTDKLQNPQEALAYAEKAASLAPDRLTVHDTLAATLIALGRHDEADAALTRALRLRGAPADKATVLMRLARLRLDRGDRQSAKEYAQQAGEWLARDPQLQERRQPELDDLLARIEAAR